MKLERLDELSLDFLIKAVKKAVFKEITGNESFALARACVVIEDLLKKSKQEELKIVEPKIELKSIPIKSTKGKKRG